MTIEQRVNEANQKVMDILLNGRPVWKDVRPALEAIPGYDAGKHFGCRTSSAC